MKGCLKAQATWKLQTHIHFETLPFLITSWAHSSENWRGVAFIFTSPPFLELSKDRIPMAGSKKPLPWHQRLGVKIVTCLAVEKPHKSHFVTIWGFCWLPTAFSIMAGGLFAKDPFWGSRQLSPDPAHHWGLCRWGKLCPFSHTSDPWPYPAHPSTGNIKRLLLLQLHIVPPGAEELKSLSCDSWGPQKPAVG